MQGILYKIGMDFRAQPKMGPVNPAYNMYQKMSCEEKAAIVILISPIKCELFYKYTGQGLYANYIWCVGKGLLHLLLS